MAFLKGVGSFLLALAVAAVLGLLSFIFIYGAEFVSAWTLPYMASAIRVAMLVCIFMLPLSLIHKARLVTATGFMISSYVFGICAWMLGLLTTLHYWGVIGVIVGLAIAGLGVVPVAMLAAAIHTSWDEVLFLAVALIFTYGARMLALWIGAKYDIEEERRKMPDLKRTAAKAAGPVANSGEHNGSEGGLTDWEVGSSTVAIVNGYRILAQTDPIGPHGRVFMVYGLGKSHLTLDGAKQIAESAAHGHDF
jgi:hypothetical protein